MPGFIPLSPDKLALAYMPRFMTPRSGVKIVIARMNIEVYFDEEDLELVKAANRRLAYDTGKMTEGWYIAGNYLINPVPYAGFVEYGHRTVSGSWVPAVHVLTSCIPAISKKWSERLRKQIRTSHFFSPEDLTVRLGLR
jgi:hypothetical protein